MPSTPAILPGPQAVSTPPGSAPAPGDADAFTAALRAAGEPAQGAASGTARTRRSDGAPLQDSPPPSRVEQTGESPAPDAARSDEEAAAAQGEPLARPGRSVAETGALADDQAGEAAAGTEGAVQPSADAQQGQAPIKQVASDDPAAGLAAAQTAQTAQTTQTAQSAPARRTDAPSANAAAPSARPAGAEFADSPAPSVDADAAATGDAGDEGPAPAPAAKAAAKQADREPAPGKTAAPTAGAAKTAQAQAAAEVQASAQAPARPHSQPQSQPQAEKPAGQEGPAVPADAESDIEPVRAGRDAHAAERATFGQARAEAVKTKASTEAGAGRMDAKSGSAQPQAAQSAPPSGAAASKPLADLLALQMQTAASGAPILVGPEAAPLDTPIEGEAEMSLETGQMRAEARGEALRAPGQAGQPARFTPHTVQHVAARIAHTAANGGRTVDIRLDPPELGRVEVRLEMDADNSVRAILRAERADTLAELQRSARDLEKALEEAGLDLAEDGLEFSLSQHGEDAPSERGGRFTPVFAESDILAEPAGPPEARPAQLYGFALSERARLDVRV